ncbi:MAG: ATP-binding protein, partial [Betaproteobacteria bacterium]
IRTPMNGVLGMLELLSLTELDAAQRATLEVVRESGRTLQRIIDDILDLSKIEAGKLEVRPEAASIRSALEAVRDIYSGIASGKGVLLECKVDQRIRPALMVDTMRLRQILNNLVSNALKFTDQGQVEIEAELVAQTDSGDRVRFSVKDSGIGISPEDQESVFQPFVQATADASPRLGGSGLGLAICQRLAQMMGSPIEMVSEPGSGTTMSFELSLPRADPAAVAVGEPAGRHDWLVTLARRRRPAPEFAAAEAEGTLVLVADDHPTNRALIESQVNTLGYAAESAGNGAEALVKWKSGRFGMLITDCNMPGMNGYELARSIREIESARGDGKQGAKRIPIIACTANALGGEAEICFAAGIDDYLAKPVELKSLLKKLDRWLPIPQSAAPVDRTVLAAISGGDRAKERAFLANFRRVNDADAADLRNAAEKCDLPDLTSAAHRINGASRMVGAVALAAVCQRLEGACRAGDLKQVEANMGAFQRELAKLNSYCEEAACASPS